MIEIGSLKFTGSLGKTAGKTISRENGRMNSTPFHTGEEQSIKGWRNYGEFWEFQGLLNFFSLKKSIKKNSEHNLMFKGWMAQHQTAKHIFKNRSRSFYRFLECLRPRWSRFRTCGWSGNSSRTRSNPACWVTLWTFCVSSAFLGSSRSLTTFKGKQLKGKNRGEMDE